MQGVRLPAGHSTAMVSSVMILSGLVPSVNSGSDGHDKVLQVPLFQLDEEIQIVTGAKELFDDLKKLLLRDIVR
jgi:hypothetical protein